MFIGEYAHTIDRKGRLIIPSKFRQEFKAQEESSTFLTRGMDGCLWLLGESEWRKIESRINALPFTKAAVRELSRQIFTNASEVSFDRFGRILIPKKLRDLAGLVQEVVVTGVSVRIEIWAKDKWQDVDQSSRQRYEEVAEQIMLE